MNVAALPRWDADVLAAVAVVVAVVALAFVSKSVGTSAPSDADAGRGRQLLSQSMEWARLSEQDTVPVFAVRHAAFALAYLNAARLVTSDKELQRQGSNVHSLSTRLEARLTSTTNKLSKSCSKTANPASEPATSISWV